MAEKISHTKEVVQLTEGIRKAKSLTSSDLSLSPSDTIICSSLKTGTTWLKSLAFSIVTRTQFDLSSKHHPILSSLSHDLIPLIEVDIALHHTPRDPDLPLLSTHLPFSGLPVGPVLDSACKIVYIYRDPKDVFVSYWHFIKKIGSKELDSMCLEEVLDGFCSKTESQMYGNYWDHVLGYWKASLDYPERFLLLKYEDMMNDVVPCVKRLAEFIGYPFSRGEEDGDSGVVATIVEMCSFGNLSKLEVNKTGKHRQTHSNSIYFRKAEVGDWSNYLTPEMANKLDQITLIKFANTSLVF